jgi:iron complex transport system substrate-binding protein
MRTINPDHEIPDRVRLPAINKTSILVILLCLVQACYSPGNEQVNEVEEGAGTTHARGFRIETFPGFTILGVQDPWQGSSGNRLEYVLASDLTLIPDSLMHLPAVQTPVSRVICMSTTHVAMIEALGKTQSIVGISGPHYLSNPLIRERVEAGEDLDVGAEQSLNYERIVSLKPGVVMAYGITAEVSGMVKRLKDLGITVILNGDYLENEPLGKTEWLRFIAAFYEMGKEADSVFNGIQEEYENYCQLAKNIADRPGVMTGLPWKDSWYVPGGNSFAAAFIRDAGGEYIWSDVDSREASPIDLESVFVRGAIAEFWINSGSALSLEDIRSTEARLVGFKPFREGTIYNNTARLNETGGNDFWETGVMEPQLILADLIRIFHPGLLQGHELRYYEQLH